MLIKVNVNGFWLKGRVNGRGWIQMIQTESRWLGESSQSGIGDQVCNCAVTWWLLVNILTYVRRSLRFVQWRMIQHEWTGLMELTARLGFYPSNGLLIGGKLPLLVESWQEQTGAENLNIEVSCVTVKNRAAAGSAKFFFFFFFFFWCQLMKLFLVWCQPWPNESFSWWSRPFSAAALSCSRQFG